MMRSLLKTLLVSLLFAVSASAATIAVPAGGDLQAALNVAQCGDTIVIEAGATFTASGIEQPFQLKAKPCTDSSWITIKGSNSDALPSTLKPLSVSAIQNLRPPRIVTSTAYPALEAVASANRYRLVGIEVTNDSRGRTIVNNGLIYAGVRHGSSPAVTLATVPRLIEFDRCWVHSEEDGSDSETATALRGFWLAAADIRIVNSRVAGFRAQAPGTVGGQSTHGVLIEKGPGPYLIDNSYLEAWFTSIFTGGGPQWIVNQATVSSASLTQATLSNVNSLTVGDLVAFKVSGQPTVYQVARVTSVSGSTIQYVPQQGLPVEMGNPLRVAPAVPGDAVWNGDLPRFITITRNRFWKNPIVGARMAASTACGVRSDGSPLGCFGKGHIELKAGEGVFISGNDFGGFSSGFTFTSRNQSDERTSGNNPWATVRNVTVVNNHWSATAGNTGLGNLIGIQLTDNLVTTIPGANVVFENNLFENIVGPLLNIAGSHNVIFQHNTAVGAGDSNELKMIFGYAGANQNFKLENNLLLHNEYGLICSMTDGGCWPGLSMAGNVIVDNRSAARKSAEGSLVNRYPNNFIAPSFASLRLATDWSLSADSPYAGRGTDGRDPGCDIAAMWAAIGGAPQPTPSPTTTPTPSPSATPTPTPTPAPSPTPSAITRRVAWPRKDADRNKVIAREWLERFRLADLDEPGDWAIFERVP